MKKKLSEWQGDLTAEQFKVLTEKLTKENNTDNEYTIEEIKAFLPVEKPEKPVSEQSVWVEWLKVKATWAKDNWIMLTVGIVATALLVWFLKWIYKNVIE